jgi:hypothetical protein
MACARKVVTDLLDSKSRVKEKKEQRTKLEIIGWIMVHENHVANIQFFESMSGQHGSTCQSDDAKYGGSDEAR